jgi:hypothetical protein
VYFLANAAYRAALYGMGTEQLCTNSVQSCSARLAYRDAVYECTDDFACVTGPGHVGTWVQGEIFIHRRSLRIRNYIYI